MQAAPAPTVPAIVVAPAVAVTPTMSVDEFLVAYAGEPRAELVRGVVRMQPVTNPVHGWIGIRFGWVLAQFVDTNDLVVADTLTPADVLPGFAVPVARLFPG